jgi:chromosome segregation ATPase
MLGEEAKMAEEKQLEFEGQINNLQDEMKILNDESKWEEEKQLKMEEELSELINEKERCVHKCLQMDRLLAEFKDREELSKATFENFAQKLKDMADVVEEVKKEVKQYSELVNKQDEDMTALEELMKEKENELATVNSEKSEEIRLLEGKLQDQDAAMKRLLNEVESSVQAADEMEDLLQRKIAELQRTKENVGKLEVHSKSLLDKTLVLEEKEMRAQSELMKAQAEIAEANKTLESQQHEFSSR